MSTIDRPDRRVLPPLESGQHLDQHTFHERYAAMPEGTWAELIGGVVHMPSPLRNEHASMSENVSGWLFLYRRATPGVLGAGNATTKLGNFGEVQPDSCLRLPDHMGGQTRIIDGYITGAPELVVEIAKSSRTLDLGPKKRDYERAGVREYLVVALEPDEVRWFFQANGRFVEGSPGPDGIFHSHVFPGLWLDSRALLLGDLERISRTVELGVATPEHAGFVARLAAGARE